MKTPAFWQTKNRKAAMLLPLAGLMILAGWMGRLSARPRKLPVPVICIGNATAGGAGKTPVALTVAKILQEQGQQPHILSRGYGGKFHALPCRVTSAHTAADVGDEPLLLAQAAPCWVGVDRVDSSESAIEAGATLILMDDGLQNPSLEKTLSLLVVSGATGFGNGWVIPAGPLREPLFNAFDRAQAIVLVGSDTCGVSAHFPGDIPVFTGRLDPLEPLSSLPQPALAFAGLGYPQKFFNMLRKGGVKLAAAVPYPDHHPYTAADRQALRAEARRLHAHLVTTSKDAVKWPAAERADLKVVEVAFRFDDETAFRNFLQEKLRQEDSQDQPDAAS